MSRYGINSLSFTLIRYNIDFVNFMTLNKINLFQGKLPIAL